MHFKAKLGVWIGVGLVTFLAMLVVNMAGNHLEQASTSSGEQAVVTGENLNESDSGTWLAEYESDGVRGASGIPVKTLPAGKAVLPTLLLIISGALVVGVERHKLSHTKRLSSLPVPKAVWSNTKLLQNQDFAAFIESSLK